MTDNNLKICQNNLSPNPLPTVDAKFDLVLRPISHGSLAMPFTKFSCHEVNVKFDDIYVCEYTYFIIVKNVLNFHKMYLKTTKLFFIKLIIELRKCNQIFSYM